VLFYTLKALAVGRDRWAQRRPARENLPYRWNYDAAAWKQQSLDSHHRSLQRVADVARTANVPLTVLVLPERGQVYGQLSDLPNRKVMALLERLELPALDLLPPMHAEALSGPDFYNRAPAGHFSPAGHAVVANVLVAYLGSDPVPARDSKLRPATQTRSR
jgi:hypothetical protein